MTTELLHPPEMFLSHDEIEVLKRTFLSGYTDDEQEAFTRLCQRTLLDPFTKQIYATKRWVKNRDGNKIPTLVPVTSVVGLTAIAVRTGTYDGCEIFWCGADGIWKEEWIEDAPPTAAKCIVYHKERSHPEVGIALWNAYCGQSYNQTTKRWEVSDFWERMGSFMLGKCAKAQALRGAYPDQCSNLYISEELQGGASEADELNDETKVANNRKKEEELLKKAATQQNVKVVENKAKTKPTPAEAAAPAPEPPPVAAPVTQAAPPDPGTFTQATALEPKQEPAQEPPQAPVDQGEPPDDIDMEPSMPPAEAPKGTWATHVIQGLKNPKFFERAVGSLSVAELQAIESQWLPKVKSVWDQVNSLQRADAEAFEAALAAAKSEKPW